MSCGCNKVRVYSESNPLIIGEPDGNPPIKVRATIAVMGLRAGSEFWAAGSALQTMLAGGWLVAI
jgi:hypothetical protein